MAKMTLTEFLSRAPVLLDAFAAATRERQEANDPEFVGEYLTRTEDDWAREFSAWATFIEMEREATED